MACFDNKVVLVSGGARGQGAAEARLLAAQGAKVVIGDVLDNQGQVLATFSRGLGVAAEGLAFHRQCLLRARARTRFAGFGAVTASYPASE
jgi:NAD(P)-dependent dehydrogenase (short-subunit alcohol dehydrogenase family)